MSHPHPGLLCLLLAAALAGCAAEPAQGSASPSPAVVSQVEAPETPEEEPEEEDPWYLTLVSREHPIPEDFPEPELTWVRGEQYVDIRIYDALKDMLRAARAEGLEPLVCSSYRSRERQEELYRDQVRQFRRQGYDRRQAEDLAAQWVSPPGASEHQLGLAVDIVDLDYQLLDEGQADTETQVWLMAHCAEYGFILRYPDGKREITGVSYEPWHYRYVGKEAAQAISDGGLCLEEYLEED